MPSKTSQLVASALLAIAASQIASAEMHDKVETIGGVLVHYKLVLPNGFDPARAYPAVLAFPGGSQSMGLAQGMVDGIWRAQAEKRGYIVVVPAAPDGDLFFEDGARVFPEFVTKLLAEFRVEGGKFNVAGMSNGGLSAFHIAALYPQYFLSITAFPGYLLDPTAARANAISGMCIWMYAGELDTDWRSAMKQQAEQFRTQGFDVKFTLEPGQHHGIETLAGAGAARLFDEFDQARRGCRSAQPRP
jgi:poly(3-hydroxybutyrate) depolymerase